MRRWTWMAALAALTLAVACSESVEPTGSAGAEIGAAGGTVASPDGRVVLDFPEGALDGTHRITVDEGVATAFGEELVGGAYAFGPHGLTFATPVTVVFQVAEPDAALDYEVVNLDGEAPVALEASAWDPESGTLTAPLEHFSRYGVRVRHRAHRFAACVRRCVDDRDDRARCVALCAERVDVDPDRCAVLGRRVLAACVDDGIARARCRVRAAEAVDRCEEADRADLRCARFVRHVYAECIDTGAAPERCRARAAEAAERCDADDDPRPRCGVIARRVYGACVEAGGEAERCRAVAGRALDRCEDARDGDDRDPPSRP